MTRATMSSAIPADVAEVLSDNERPYSPEEEAFIVHRTDGLLAERLNDRAPFRDLMSGIDLDDICGPLHRALMNLDRAIKGEYIARDAIYTALDAIHKRLGDEAETTWRDECRAEAERQLKREFA